MVSLPEAIRIEFRPLPGITPRRKARPAAPEWRCDIPGPVLSAIQAGVMRTAYKGRACLKSPFDVMLYLQLLQRLQPKTVIEIGTNEGGSALLFADMLMMLGVGA